MDSQGCNWEYVGRWSETRPDPLEGLVQDRLSVEGGDGLVWVQSDEDTTHEGVDRVLEEPLPDVVQDDALTEGLQLYQIITSLGKGARQDAVMTTHSSADSHRLVSGL